MVASDTGTGNNSGSADDDAAIFIAYGANLSSQSANESQSFAAVVKDLQARGLKITTISRLWKSAAWPDPTQPPYVNAVMRIETDRQPTELMEVLHAAEAAAGRVRSGLRNEPRVLDLDLIAYGRESLTGDNGPIVPHPRAHDRAFVMGPLAEIAPQWRHPVSARTAAELYAHATVGTDAQPLAD